MLVKIFPCIICIAASERKNLNQRIRVLIVFIQVPRNNETDDRSGSVGKEVEFFVADPERDHILLNGKMPGVYNLFHAALIVEQVHPLFGITDLKILLDVKSIRRVFIRRHLIVVLQRDVIVSDIAEAKPPA